MPVSPTRRPLARSVEQSDKMSTAGSSAAMEYRMRNTKQRIQNLGIRIQDSVQPEIGTTDPADPPAVAMLWRPWHRTQELCATGHRRLFLVGASDYLT